jgi:hypothetical protein
MRFALLSATVFLIVLFAGSLWKRRFGVAFLSGAVLCILAVVLVFANEVQVRGDDDWKTTGCLFLAMVLGMTSKYLWGLIEIRRVKVEAQRDAAKKPPLGFDIWDFIQPLLVSGIVFSGVSIGHPKLEWATVLFSYQNGFFWQTVLARKERAEQNP